MKIRPFDHEAIREQVRSAKPFPHFCIDNFLEPIFAKEVLASFPSFQQAEQMGMKFNAVNEKNKIQITDSSKFPEPILKLHQELSSPE